MASGNSAYLWVVFFLQALCLQAQNGKKPVARFSFNNNTAVDEVSGHAARVSGAMFVEDRFGNSNNAIFLTGNVYSYINLGCYKALKPASGSISLWVNIENEVYSGWGPSYNPIILTKYLRLDDFYEAYGIYYMYDSDRIVAVTSRDSTRENPYFSKRKIKKNVWHHIVFVYNYNRGALYIDGELEMELPKKFETTFLEDDSVVVGHTANLKNSRYLNGAVDDIEFYDRVLNDEEIRELYEAPDPEYGRKLFLYWFWRCTAVTGFVLALYFMIRYRLKREVIKEKRQLELTNKILETDLRVNRALMNPHFVFNSLNSLQNFIMSKDHLQANNYLVKFSKLMRKLLESNISNTISLEQEVELLTTYMDLEDVRFEKGISYTIEIDPRLVPSKIEIPVMLLQPFVENAIWHGLLKKTGEKVLRIIFSKQGARYLQCIIDDNGLGRKKAEAIGNKKSFATVFVRQRLDLLNKIHGLNCTLVIDDKPEEQGTIVTILLPILKRQ